MRIGIDISQMVYEKTGVATYVTQMVEALVSSSSTNEYVLFAAAVHHRQIIQQFYQRIHAKNSRTRLVLVPIPPTILEFLWNTLHVVPVEWFAGALDIFWSSDWTQPPLSAALGVTTIHDVSFFYYPESFARRIVEVQKRRLVQAKKTCEVFLCDSIATKRDVVSLLGISEKKAFVVYPGVISN